MLMLTVFIKKIWSGYMLREIVEETVRSTEPYSATRTGRQGGHWWWARKYETYCNDHFALNLRGFRFTKCERWLTVVTSGIRETRASIRSSCRRSPEMAFILDKNASTSAEYSLCEIGAVVTERNSQYVMKECWMVRQCEKSDWPTLCLKTLSVDTLAIVGADVHPPWWQVTVHISSTVVRL